MACEICGRQACSRCFHSIEAQEAFDAAKGKCPDCDGKGEYEAQIGGDGYDDRCCALADVMCVCPTCKGTGRA